MKDVDIFYKQDSTVWIASFPFWWFIIMSILMCVQKRRNVQINGTPEQDVKIRSGTIAKRNMGRLPQYHFGGGAWIQTLPGPSEYVSWLENRCRDRQSCNYWPNVEANSELSLENEQNADVRTAFKAHKSQGVHWHMKWSKQYHLLFRNAVGTCSSSYSKTADREYI